MDLAGAFPARFVSAGAFFRFDRMSKSIWWPVNPFNQQAAKELADATANRLLWYLVPPSELVKNLRKAFVNYMPPVKTFGERIADALVRGRLVERQAG